MVNVEFTDLPLATTPLAGSEIVALVQDGVSVQSTVASLSAGGSGGGDGWIVFDYDPTDNAANINTAVNYCISVGASGVRAPWVLPGTTFPIGSTRVNLQDQAFKGISMEHTVFVCTHPDAGLDFSMDAPIPGPGVPARYGYGCINGNFSIAGGDAYMEGIATRPMQVGPRTMNRFENITIASAALSGDAICLLLWSTQNSLFTNLHLFNGEVILRLDGGTANNHFLKCEIAGGTEHHVEFRNDLDPFPGQLDYTFDNVFESTIIEWTETTTDALIYQTVGAYNAFFHCPMFVNGHLGGSGGALPVDMDYAVKLELTEGPFCTVQVESCEMTGYSVVLEGFIGVGENCEVLLSAGTMQRAIRGVHGGGLCNMGEECRFLATVTTRLAIFAFRDHRGINRYYGTSGTDLMMRFRVEGESFDRHYVDTNGAHYWGPGSGAVDLNMYRNGAATLTVTGSFGVTADLVATRIVRPGVGATGSRPGGMPQGSMWYDSTLGKPIWYTGSVWKDAAGTTV